MIGSLSVSEERKGSSIAQNPFWKVVVQNDVEVQGGFQIGRCVEAMGLQHLLAAAVETLHPAISLGPTGRNQAVLNSLFGAESVEVLGA